MVDAEYLSLHRSDWRLRFGPNGVLSSVVAKNCFIHELHYLCLWRHLKDDSPWMGPLRTIEAVSAWVGRMANSRDKSWWHYWCHICQWTDCTCNDHHKTGISSCFMQVDTFNLTTNIDYRLPTFTFLFCPTGHHCILWWACDRAHLRRDHDQLKTTQSPAWLMIMCPWQCSPQSEASQVWPAGEALLSETYFKLCK